MLVDSFLQYESAINALRIVRHMFPDKRFYIQNDVPSYLFDDLVMIDNYIAWGVYQTWDYE